MRKARIRLFPKIKQRRGSLSAEGDKGQRYCPNCHYPLPHYGEFCSNCGQRFTDGRVPLKFLLEDLIDNVLNIDSRFFRTLWSLAIPGKLTNEFFKGHHKRYASPGRLFFIATIVHFAVIGFLINILINNGGGGSSEREKRHAYELLYRDSLEKARAEVDLHFAQEPKAQEALDSLFSHLKKEKRDTQYIGYAYFDANWNLETKNVYVSEEDLFTLSPAALAEKNGINDKLESLFFQQVVKVRTEPENFGQFAIGQLVWMVVLMMPALALILKLLYIRRKRYFVEHLVFSFHYHAFAFWAMTIMLLTMHWTNSWESEITQAIVIPTVFLGIMIYQFIAMRRVYKQGFFKTFIKYNILNFAYLMIFTLFLALTIAVSTLLY